MYIKEKTLGENYMAGYELWRKREESNDNKCRCKITVKPENLHFKNKKITAVENDEIKENARLNICSDTEDHTKE
jgi:hypothetical protein